ncbi:MAG: hypothetical protein L0211_21060 [Planctomycetaceae bacterium]|nr:hypothetical protein [Planctomycetaceae bacterium]
MRTFRWLGLWIIVAGSGFLQLQGFMQLGADEPAAPARPRVTVRPRIKLISPPVKVAQPASSAAEKPAAKSKPAVEIAVEEAATIKPGAEATASHEQIAAVEVKGEEGSTLQTLSCTPDGKIVGLVAPGRYAPIGVTGKSAASSEVRLYSGEGKELQRWSLPFTGQSVGVGPNGTIYVAGDGRLAKYSADGKLLANVEVPHLAEALKDQEGLKKKAEEQLKQEQLSFLNSKKVYEQIVKQLEENKQRSPTEEQQLKTYKNYLENFDTNVAARTNRKIDDVVKQITSRLRMINGIAATEKDVYIACGEMVGYGYAIWRMDEDLANPERVLGPVSGCCGQMDIQARGDHFYLSENTKKRVAQYDRTGKLVSAFGKSGRESDGLSFGGCCNPMNCRVCATGDIITAESEGIVKRFSATGEFLGLVGYAKLTGGCKNVAVAASPKGDRVYFCDLPGSRIIILAAKKAEAAGE